jgi:rubrerythrin
MNKKKEILTEMIMVERNAAALYRLFAERFKEDSKFWQKIGAEEEKHAELLQSGVLFLALDMLPDVVLIDEIDLLRHTNASIAQITKRYADAMPPKREAYNYAIQMEKSLGEKFFQELLRMKFAPEVVALWQRLGEESVDHSSRIATLLV